MVENRPSGKFMNIANGALTSTFTSQSPDSNAFPTRSELSQLHPGSS